MEGLAAKQTRIGETNGSKGAYLAGSCAPVLNAQCDIPGSVEINVVNEVA